MSQEWLGTLQKNMRDELGNSHMHTYVHGGEARHMVTRNEEIQPGRADILVICGTCNREEARDAMNDQGGRMHLQASLERFMTSRHFSVDQVVIGPDGKITYGGKLARLDLAAKILRPTRWALHSDPARGQYGLSSRLCGRAVRLMVKERFTPSPALARYLADHCEELLKSRGFWWHCARIDGVGSGVLTAVARRAMQPG